MRRANRHSSDKPRVLLAALLLLVGIAGSGRAHAQSSPAPATPSQQDVEARDDAAAVLLEGEPVLWITVGAGPYSAAFRAERISERLLQIIRDHTLADPKVSVVDVEGSSELRVGPHLLMVVTRQDADSLGASRATLALQYSQLLETAIRTERQRYAPAALMRSAAYALLATIALVGVVWLIVLLTRTMRQGLVRLATSGAGKLHALEAEIVAPERLGRTIRRITLAARIVLFLIAFGAYLTYVLGLFPWTRAVSYKLADYALTPVRTTILAVVAYLPKLLFLIVITAAVSVAIRLVDLFFRQIERGHLAFATFPAEWADPTNKIARVLLVAFGVVVAFPYLPASSSPAFTGVSVFMGVLVSLASSSALSNVIAGIVLTYTGAFRKGDRVKLGDSYGDIVKTSLLATHIRSIKNEEITIPNSIALGSAVTNYTRDAATLGLILHTTVTIGYAEPWRKIHDLLVSAARGTPGILADPPPFVWQTALNDFYVTYEINAFTAAPADMIQIYADLHAKIQDSFYAAGVEIMSPHYTALRDGNTVAVPEASRPADYRVPAFQIEERRATREALSDTHRFGRHR